MSIYACELPPTQLKVTGCKKIILWSGLNLLGFSVEYLLNTRPDWKVIHLSDDQGTQALINSVQSENPDIVVIYQTQPSDITDLVTHLMRNQQWLKIIIVTLDHNTVEVLNKQQVSIVESTDLLSIVEGCPHLPCLAENQ